MKRQSIFLFCVLSLFSIDKSDVLAESMTFKRTDSNNATANAQWSYYDQIDSAFLNDADPDSDNTLAISFSSGTPSSVSGSAVTQSGSEAVNIDSTNSITYTPNSTADAYFQANYTIGDVILNVGAGANSLTQYELQSPVDPNIDTVVATAVLQVSQGGEDLFAVDDTLAARAKSLGIEVVADFSITVIGQGWITISDGNSVLWSNEVGLNAAHTVIVEKSIPTGSIVEMRSFAGAGVLVPGSNNSLVQKSGQTTASCALSAVGYDSSVNPPPFSGLRVFVQRIACEGEEQEPPQLVYPEE